MNLTTIQILVASQVNIQVQIKDAESHEKLSTVARECQELANLFNLPVVCHDRDDKATETKPLKYAGSIQNVQIVTKKGNTLNLFYNPENNLVVLDLVAENEQGGNELLRQTLNETKLLKHSA